MLGGGHSADAAMWLRNTARLLAGGAHPFGGDLASRGEATRCPRDFLGADLCAWSAHNKNRRRVRGAGFSVGLTGFEPATPTPPV